MALRPLLVAALLAAASPLVAAQGGSLPPGCEPSQGSILCTWRIDTREEPARDFYDLPLPPGTPVVAEITVLLEGQDAGWMYFILVGDVGARREIHGHEHDGTRTPGSSTVVARETTIVLYRLDPGDEPLFRFFPRVQGAQAGGVQITDVTPGPRSVGVFTIAFRLDALPPGLAPPRPAATRDDPHLAAPRGDARRGGFDVVAAWLDDDHLGDGLIEARLVVADMEDWGFREGGVRAGWSFSFVVKDVLYDVVWRASTPQPVADPANLATACGLNRQTPGGAAESVTTPFCHFDWANDTFWASFPTRAIGDPGDGVAFTDMSARSFSGGYLVPGGSTYSSTGESVEDEIAGERYPFALGGPPVWDVLNPRLAIPSPPDAPWYVEPLSRENLPDTLQVGGALLAALTFTTGFVLVRRVRALTRAIVTRIDEVERRHESDAKAGLLALGRLETEFTDLFRKGRLNESQYQLAMTRIATVANRLARRQELGLDDGVPDGPIT